MQGDIMSLRDLTPNEVWLLNKIFQLEEADVPTIHEYVFAEKKWKYTTVMTIASTLYEKGYLSRKKVGRCYVYKPVVSLERVFEKVVDRLFGSMFKDNPTPLLNYLVNTKKLSEREQDILRTILDIRSNEEQ